MKILGSLVLLSPLLFSVLGLGSLTEASSGELVLRREERNRFPILLVNQESLLTYSLENVKDPEYDGLVTFDFFSKPQGVISIPQHEISVAEPSRGKFVKFSLNITGESSGLTILNVSSSDKNIDLTFAGVVVKVMHYQSLVVLSNVVGWMYFVAWSISFYPQIYENWRRKSVIGLNFDFLSLNIIGFALYSAFNFGLFFVPLIQDQYFFNNPGGVNPVKLNDVIFSTHATLACAITMWQCFIYERGNQSVSRPCRILMIVITLFLLVWGIITAFSVTTVLNFLYICSYVKLLITLIKYVPQAYMNYRRKSTCGWSIGNVLLDSLGGLLSIGQMIIDAYNFDDWKSIFGDLTKFGLGLFSICFDIVFILQHYVFYRNTSPYENTDDLSADDEENSQSE